MKDKLFRSDVLRRCLQERGMSQAKLARTLGVNPRVVSRWCNGQREPSVENCWKMARVLRVPIDALVRNPRYEGGEFDV